MRLSMEEVQKQHESTKKLYEQGLTVAPVDVKRVLDLYDTIEDLQAENEQLRVQVVQYREACIYVPEGRMVCSVCEKDPFHVLRKEQNYEKG